MTIAASMSGLTSAAKSIEIIGNNIANAQTIGFKTSKASFAAALASAGGTSDKAPSAGVGAAIVSQNFKQGSMTQSGKPLDMAIMGLGFFRLSDSGDISYSRDGQFRLAYDSSRPDTRDLVNHNGLRVTGYLAEYTADPQGVIAVTGSPQEIVIDPLMPAAATTNVKLGATLDGRIAPPLAAPFATNDPLTYSSSAGLGVFDSTGVAHDLRMYFSKAGPGNFWNLHSTLDGASQIGPVSLSFDVNGLMATPMPLAQTYSLSGGGSLSVALDLSGTVQFGSLFAVDSISQDGYPVGVLTNSGGFGVGTDGVIRAGYSNGQSRNVAQLVLANFANPGGLISIGNNQWTENRDPASGSGDVVLDTPGRSMGSGMGAIQSGANELSNVNLSNELVALIEQQRNYQASAQTFKILDQILQKLQNATQG